MEAPLTMEVIRKNFRKWKLEARSRRTLMLLLGEFDDDIPLRLYPDGRPITPGHSPERKDSENVRDPRPVPRGRGECDLKVIKNDAPVSGVLPAGAFPATRMAQPRSATPAAGITLPTRIGPPTSTTLPAHTRSSTGSAPATGYRTTSSARSTRPRPPTDYSRSRYRTASWKSRANRPERYRHRGAESRRHQAAQQFGRLVRQTDRKRYRNREARRRRYKRNWRAIGGAR